jgi:formylglycine-generating enzyme
MTDSRAGMLRQIERGRFRVEHPLAVNAKDGSLLVHVPAGEFEMGSAEGEGNVNERPRHRVELSGYWIGVYAVTNAQYLKFVEVTGHRAPANTRHREKAMADHPVTDVSWEDSFAYAKWAGCKLASEAQWECACRGPLGLAYPWGQDWDETKCRNDKNKGSEQTSVVYGYEKGVSGWGTYNQSGNVWEWCADWYDENYYASSPKESPKEPERGSCRVFRGGSWRYGDPGFFRAAYRGWYDPGSLGGGAGFRLVRAAS